MVKTAFSRSLTTTLTNARSRESINRGRASVLLSLHSLPAAPVCLHDVVSPETDYKMKLVQTHVVSFGHRPPLGGALCRAIERYALDARLTWNVVESDLERLLFHHLTLPLPNN